MADKKNVKMTEEDLKLLELLIEEKKEDILKKKDKKDIWKTVKAGVIKWSVIGSIGYLIKIIISKFT